ncbi:MAG TPA: TolC family protein [Candidatus Ozemobacteraceae bacterium]
MKQRRGPFGGWRLAVCLVLAILAGSSVFAQASGPLSLEDVVALVKSGNASLRQARLQVARADEQVAAARTKTKPRIGTYLLGTHALETPEIFVERGMLGELPKLGAFPPNAVTFSESRRNSLYSLISMTYPVTRQRDIRTGIRMSETARDLAESGAAQATLDVVCETKKLYCSILALENARAANATAIRLFSEYAETIGRLVAEGYAQKADLLDVKARLEQVRAREEALRLKRESLVETLGRLCGIENAASISLVPLPEPSGDPASDTVSIDNGLPNHPRVREGGLRKKLAELDRELAKGEFRPSVALTADRLQGHRTAEYLPKHVSAMGLLVSWDPFDWGKRRHELKEKQLACLQAGIALEETGRAVREAIHAARRQLQEADARFAAARAKSDWAEEQARVFRNRLVEKAILPRELLEAEAELAEARFLQHQACLDAWIARAELDRALGELR